MLRYRKIAVVAVSGVLFSFMATPLSAGATTSEGPYKGSDHTLPVSIADSEKLWHATWQDDRLDKPKQTPDGTARAIRTTDQSQDPHIYFKTDSKGKILDRVFASPEQDVVDESTGRTTLEWSASTNSANLNWWSPDPAVEWEVSRNGKKVATVSGDSFTDSAIDRSRNNEYSVQAAVTDGSLLEENETTDYFYAVNLPPAPEGSVGKNIGEPAVRGLARNTDAAGLEGMEPQVMRDTFVAYGSFIPESRIKRPFGCTPASYDQFGGDNRKFAHKANNEWESLRYRGLNIAYLTWSGKKAALDEAFRKVGETHAYENGKLVAKKTASAAGLKTSLKADATNGYATIHLKQSISNPLCKVAVVSDAPKIDADVSVKLKQSTGYTRITGEHDGAPNHEILMRHVTSSEYKRGCLYRFAHGSFNSLLPPMDVSVDITRNPNGNWLEDCPIYEK